MVVLRRTERLRAQLPVSGSADDVSDTALGDWYVNRTVVRRRPLLLMVSSASLLPIVLPAQGVRALPERLCQIVGDRLQRLGVAERIARLELERMERVVVGKTRDRAVLGIMVDFAKALPHYIQHTGALNTRDLGSVEAKLETTPCYVSQSFENVVFPRDRAIKLLDSRWSAA